MGKIIKKIEKQVRSIGKTPAQKEKIQTRLKRKCAELNKRYKDSKYEVVDNYIIRKSGRNPHSISKKSADFIKKAVEVTVEVNEVNK